VPIYLTTDNLVIYRGLRKRGPGRMTSDGTTLTCTTAHGLSAGDWIWIAGQERKVAEVTSSSAVKVNAGLSAEVYEEEWAASVDNGVGMVNLYDSSGSAVGGASGNMTSEGRHGDYSATIPYTITLSLNAVYDVQVQWTSPFELTDRERVRAIYPRSKPPE
jgi:hypothetical protein